MADWQVRGSLRIMAREVQVKQQWLC